MNYEYNVDIYEEEPKIVILSLRGRLMGMDAGKSLRFEASELCVNGSPFFLLDISKLMYVDSSGLSTLISLLTIARKNGGEAVVINPSEKVKELFIITKLMAVFNIEDEKKAGIAFLKAAIENN